jgi:hypothetical protein
MVIEQQVLLCEIEVLPNITGSTECLVIQFIATFLKSIA